ncbi:DNA-directed RNA polymerases II and IV subunit 5A-like [Magnolia sinica]|uniref:DNA-directed RNA polymerases II and IV subunit 5A-like n=1 Tax=Magnolia sinica TaxID=86752 RepID=UPI002657E7D4|nr:DNA-directed RNA polymerases II and IV subunit 5A-like [Magnolia sinica]
MSSSNKKTSDTLFWARRTLLEMINDRGYVVSNAEIGMTKEEFVEKFGENVKRGDLNFSRAKRNNPTDEICVFFVEEDKPGKNVIISYGKRMESAKISRGILVVRETATLLVKNFIETNMPKFHIEFFLEGELLINITRHYLVPMHEVLTNDEIKTLQKRYNVKATQLPRIQVKDPIARYYGLKQGQVVKVTRGSETAGRYITYRIAV